MYRGGSSATGGGFSASFVNVTSTGQFLAADGTAAAPGYAFTSTPNTGWYLAGGFLRAAVGGGAAVGISTVSFFPAGTTGTSSLGIASLAWKQIFIDFTNTGTIGAVTINKATGRVNIAAAATSVVVTNSLVTAASKVLVVQAQADANNPLIRSVVPAAGSFTITVSAAPAANQAYDFFVVNVD